MAKHWDSFLSYCILASKLTFVIFSNFSSPIQACLSPCLIFRSEKSCSHPAWLTMIPKSICANSQALKAQDYLWRDPRPPWDTYPIMFLSIKFWTKLISSCTKVSSQADIFSLKSVKSPDHKRYFKNAFLIAFSFSPFCAWESWLAGWLVIFQ